MSPVYQTHSIRTDDERIFDLFEIDMTDYKPADILVRPSSSRIVKRKADKRCIRDISCYEWRNSQVFCKIEIAPKYKKLDKVMTIINGDTLLILRPQKVEYQEIVENGKLRIISAKEAETSKNEVFSINHQNWSEWREVLCPTCGGGNKIVEIQARLRDHGYDVVLDGVLDQKTREAIVDFQKKNNLPTDKLSIATLKLLGVKLGYGNECP